MKVIGISFNGEIVKIFTSKEKVVKYFEELLKGKEFIFEDDENDEMGKMSIEKGVDFLLDRWDVIEVFNEELIERGDDYCEVRVWEEEVE